MKREREKREKRERENEREREKREREKKIEREKNREAERISGCVSEFGDFLPRSFQLAVNIKCVKIYHFKR